MDVDQLGEVLLNELSDRNISMVDYGFDFRKIDFEEIQRVWKQMVKNNHPDKLIGKGMPIEFINTANHR